MSIINFKAVESQDYSISSAYCRLGNLCKEKNYYSSSYYNYQKYLSWTEQNFAGSMLQDIIDFNAARSRDYLISSAYYHLGNLRKEQNYYFSSYHNYQKALSRTEQNFAGSILHFDILYGLVELFINANKFDEALKTANSAFIIPIMPENDLKDFIKPLLISHIMLIYSKTEQQDKMISILDQFLIESNKLRELGKGKSEGIIKDQFIVGADISEGINHVLRGEHDLAIKYLDMALENIKKWPEKNNERIKMEFTINSLLGSTFFLEENYSRALDYYRIALHVRENNKMYFDQYLDISVFSIERYYQSLLKAQRLLKANETEYLQYYDEAFQVGQQQYSSQTTQSLLRAIARAATQSGQTEIDDYQQIERQMHYLNQSCNYYSVQNGEACERNLVALLEKKENLKKEIILNNPRYFDLIDYQPLSLKDTASLLKQDEALVYYLTSKTNSFAWVLRNNEVNLVELSLSENDLAREIKALRKTLDPSVMIELQRCPSTEQDYQCLIKAEPFGVGTAHKLYKRIFEPFVHLLKGVKHIYVVSQGDLQSLPLGVLVTSPLSSQDETFLNNRQLHHLAYAKIAWLGQQYAFSYLPSVAALRALHHLPVHAQQGNLLILADPFFEDHRLKPLPQTRAIAKSLASQIGAEETLLGKEATETYFKAKSSTPLNSLAIITHAIDSREATWYGLDPAQPALALTKDNTNDGFLTVGEIAQNSPLADQVFLIGCSTAVADDLTPSERFSGLARAFMYRGSRNLLLTQWPVYPGPTATLIAQLNLSSQASQPSPQGSQPLRRAELIQKAIQKIRSYTSYYEAPYAHPMIWGGFVVFGIDSPTAP